MFYSICQWVQLNNQMCNFYYCFLACHEVAEDSLVVYAQFSTAHRIALHASIHCVSHCHSSLPTMLRVIYQKRKKRKKYSPNAEVGALGENLVIKTKKGPKVNPHYIAGMLNDDARNYFKDALSYFQATESDKGNFMFHFNIGLKSGIFL